MESDICVLVDKPIGLSSRDVSYVIRRELGLKKVGHLGTLDLEASGLLVVMSGACTKLERFLHKLDKTYEGEIVLGKKYSTDDIYGEVLAETPVPSFTQEKLDELKVKFSGEIMQEPPQVSAKKVDGKTAYKEARAGKEIKLSPSLVSCKIDRLAVISPTIIRYELTCSSGFYVRAFARDLGIALGTLGATKSIRRTRIGDLKVEDALVVAFDKTIKSKTEDCITPLDVISKLIPLPVVENIDEDVAKKIKQGNKLALNSLLNDSEEGEYCVRFEDRLISIAVRSSEEARFLVNF